MNFKTIAYIAIICAAGFAALPVAAQKQIKLDFTDEITKGTCVTHGGKVLLA